MRKTDRRAARWVLVGTILSALALPLGHSAGATGAGHQGDTITSLKAVGPTEETEHHEAAAGGWTFLVTGNRQVNSVRLFVYAATDAECSSLGSEPLYADKVTSEELQTGTAIREPAFEGGEFCTQFVLDGVRKAEATVETRHPEPVVPDPGPTASSTESSSPPASPSPTDSPSPSVSPSPSQPAPHPETSTEYDRCSGNPEVDHRVLAGATGPDPEAPFIYQKFYPSTLQVRQGDLVEWCFNGGYDWHTVTFLPADMDVGAHPEPAKDRASVWRWDETGQKAFNEGWLFGPDGGDEAKACGRGAYFTARAQQPCNITGTDTEVASSIWDRFFSIPAPGTFASHIDLPPGIYRYHCNIHSSMEGFIEVLPEDEVPVNPSPSQIDDEIAADHAAAKRVAEDLSDPSDAYDFDSRRWTVQVGAETEDRSVSIEQFLPARIDVRKGDRVRFIAGTDEPNTVTFPGGRQIEGAPESDLQGGFSFQGNCNAHECPTGRKAPWGMTGLAFVWNCDADARSSGAPGSLPYVPAATSMRTSGVVNKFGCVAGGLPEMITQPWYGDQQRAPRDLVATEKTFHNSGTILDEDLPGWYRNYPASGVLPGGTFPSTFDAKFPTGGEFKYFCSAHEFMNGVVVVKS